MKKGSKASAETRTRQRASVKKRFVEHPETRTKISAALKGRKLSTITRTKISAALKGRKLSTITRARMRRRESAEVRAKKSGKNHSRYSHGLEKHPLYYTHLQMMHRCYNPKASRYSGYGGVGITVWEPWRNVALYCFGVDALLGESPGKEYTIDRINPHGDYVEWNVRWADKSLQNKNLRKNVSPYYIQCGEH